MMLRILLFLGSMAWFAPAQQSTCHPVEGDRIQAQDLAAVLPEFQAAPAQALIGQSPLPGSQRIFHAGELQALAHRFGVSLASAADICFEWPTRPLDRPLVLAAMQESLHIPGARIELVDVISNRVPPGRIEFPVAGLGVPATASSTSPVLWRGQVVYGDSHKFALWAKVTIAADCRKWTAVDSLKIGQPIELRHLRESTVACFPTAKTLAVESIVGMIPLRPIPAGSEVRSDLLAPANDINRGDQVRVEVRSGGARLGLNGRALSGGRTGETIFVRNPESNRTFPARVTGKGSALVDTGNSKGL